MRIAVGELGAQAHVTHHVSPGSGSMHMRASQ